MRPKPKLSTIAGESIWMHLDAFGFFLYVFAGFLPKFAVSFRFALCGQLRGRGLGAVSFNAWSNL